MHPNNNIIYCTINLRACRRGMCSAWSRGTSMFSWADKGQWISKNDENEDLDSRKFRIGFEPLFVDYTQKGSMYVTFLLFEWFSFGLIAGESGAERITVRCDVVVVWCSAACTYCTGCELCFCLLLRGVVWGRFCLPLRRWRCGDGWRRVLFSLRTTPAYHVPLAACRHMYVYAGAARHWYCCIWDLVVLLRKYVCRISRLES